VNDFLEGTLNEETLASQLQQILTSKALFNREPKHILIEPLVEHLKDNQPKTSIQEDFVLTFSEEMKERSPTPKKQLPTPDKQSPTPKK
jgi:hypothetical protein